MKRSAVLLSLLLCLGFALPASAQFQWGFKGGVNVTHASFSKDIFKSDNRAGFFIGPMAEFTLPVIGLGIDGAFLFSQKKFAYETGSGYEDRHGSITQNGFDIPVNLKYTLGLGSLLGIYVAAGPNFYFDVKGSDRIFEKKTAYVGFNLGAGLKLLRHLQLGFNYNIPLGESGDIRYDDIFSNCKTKTWQISAAYLF